MEMLCCRFALNCAVILLNFTGPFLPEVISLVLSPLLIANFGMKCVVFVLNFAVLFLSIILVPLLRYS